MKSWIVCCVVAGSLQAQPQLIKIDVSSYGWLDQYSMNAYFPDFIVFQPLAQTV